MTSVRAPLAMASQACGAEFLDGVGQALAAALDVVEAAQHGGPQAGLFAVVVDVDDLVQLVVVEHRPRAA